MRTCHGYAEFGATPPLSPLGDFRSPKVYIYDTATDTLTDKTPLIVAAGPPHTNRLNTTIGLRSAGSIGDLVILAGPGFSGINLFAFNGSTGAFIGSTTLSAFNDIRKWLEVDGVLYTTVGKSCSGEGEECCGGPGLWQPLSLMISWGILTLWERNSPFMKAVSLSLPGQGVALPGSG